MTACISRFAADIHTNQPKGAHDEPATTSLFSCGKTTGTHPPQARWSEYMRTIGSQLTVQTLNIYYDMYILLFVPVHTPGLSQMKRPISAVHLFCSWHTHDLRGHLRVTRSVRHAHIKPCLHSPAPCTSIIPCLLVTPYGQ